MPTIDHIGNWNFPEPYIGGGGPGTIDYAGDCAQNNLRFIVVGPGTLTIQTEMYGVTASDGCGVGSVAGWLRKLARRVHVGRRH